MTKLSLIYKIIFLLLIVSLEIVKYNTTSIYINYKYIFDIPLFANQENGGNLLQLMPGVPYLASIESVLIVR